MNAAKRPVIFCCAAACFVMAASVRADALTPDFQMVQVDSETELATDIWLPAAETPEGGWPVLLRRTPYGRVMTEDEVAGFLNLGYAFVSQDVRGRGDSEGRFLPFFYDRTDGKAAIEWAAAQPWSSGRVCTWGGSAEGVVQLMALAENPQGLACVLASVATDDVYEGMLPGGAWREELTTAWLKGLKAPDVWAEWRENEARGPYWDPARLTPEERARIDVPVLLVGGFFDIFAPSQVRMHRDFRNQAAPSARRDQFLMYGPWTHGGVTFSDDEPVVEGEVVFIRDAAYDSFVWDIIDFFEWNLKGGQRTAWAPVRYFRTRLADSGTEASGSWRAVDQWPPAGRAVSLFLNDGRTLSDMPEPGAAAVVEIPVNPEDPVPSKGGGNLTTPAGIFDQKSIDERSDVAVFQTEPVAEDTYVEGDVTATLAVSMSSSDGDIVVRFSQVTPSGKVMMLSDGIVRGRFLKDVSNPTAVVPGEEMTVKVALGPVSFELPAGHAVRVSVAGTSWPRYEVNPGVFSTLSDPADPQQSVLKIRTGISRIDINVTGGDSWLADPLPEEDLNPVEDVESPEIVENSDVRDDGHPGDANVPASDVRIDSECDNAATCECPPAGTSGCSAARGIDGDCCGTGERPPATSILMISGLLLSVLVFRRFRTLPVCRR